MNISPYDAGVEATSKGLSFYICLYIMKIMSSDWTQYDSIEFERGFNDYTLSLLDYNVM